MRNGTCDCGATIYFENTRCLRCDAALGFDPQALEMRSLYPAGRGALTDRRGRAYRYCSNHDDYDVCNWLCPPDEDSTLCSACSLNEWIPAVAEPGRRAWWSALEAAKRRLVYGLLRMGLPVEARRNSPDGLGFAFLEDRRSNPLVEEEYVPTGHAQGLITVNLAEADDAHREHTRLALGESYRTLLGHFRHESGHYYFDRLLRNTPLLGEFRELFGDETQDYNAAMARYYAESGRRGDSARFITDYAMSHPLEDWAECWAHHLHINDTLETAAGYGLVDEGHAYGDIDEWLADWARLAEALNAMNRSMGMQDAYPFVLGAGVIDKLRFVQRVVRAGAV